MFSMSDFKLKRTPRENFLFILIFLVGFDDCHGLSAQQRSPTAVASRPYEWHVAPMQGYTNYALRHLLRLLSPDTILWTEMEKIKDLKEANPQALQKRFGNPFNDNSIDRVGGGAQQQRQSLTLQLGGNDPQALEDCVASLAQQGYRFREINLNCGCPSIEAGGAAEFGASLMKQPDLTQHLIEAIGHGCQKGGALSTTISLKCRTAVFETVEEMENSLATNPSTTSSGINEQQFQSLCSYISKAQEGGIKHVILHARPVVLTGLSPTKNRMVPPLDYDMVDAVAAEFPDLRVTLNGGVTSLHDLDLLMHRHQGHSPSSSSLTSSDHQNARVASHMAGRWMLQCPLELATVQEKYLAPRTGPTGQKTTSSYSVTYSVSLSTVLDRYMYYVEDSVTNRVHTMSEVCLPLYLIIEELRAKFDDDTREGDRMQASEDECYEAMKHALVRLSGLSPSNAKKAKAIPNDVIHWKRLSSYLKSLVGTKVYNKWKKNRNELL